MDLSQLSLDELHSLLGQVQDKIEQRRKEAESRLIEDIRQKAALLGLSADELLGKLSGGKRPSKPVSAQYRDPASGAEWSGRGRKPLWVVQWLEGGHSMDEIRINQ